jgi:hypothetical protein
VDFIEHSPDEILDGADDVPMHPVEHLALTASSLQQFPNESNDEPLLHNPDSHESD